MSENPTRKPRTPRAKPETAPISADVQALIEQNSKLAEQNSKLMEQVNQLTLAVIAGRETKAPASDEKATIRLENVIGYAIGLPVTDPRTGQMRSISLSGLNSTALLRPSELDEAMEKYPHFFEQGYLSAPDYAPANPNTIRDVGKWLDRLDLDTAMGAVAEITSLPVLYRIFNHIEEQRYSHLDENGQPIAEKDGEGKVLHYKLAENKKVDPKLLMVEMAVKRQIDSLNGGVSVNLDK
jgi:hypothetical protein